MIKHKMLIVSIIASISMQTIGMKHQDAAYVRQRNKIQTDIAKLGSLGNDNAEANLQASIQTAIDLLKKQNAGNKKRTKEIKSLLEGAFDKKTRNRNFIVSAAGAVVPADSSQAQKIIKDSQGEVQQLIAQASSALDDAERALNNQDLNSANQAFARFVLVLKSIVEIQEKTKKEKFWKDIKPQVEALQKRYAALLDRANALAQALPAPDAQGLPAPSGSAVEIEDVSDETNPNIDTKHRGETAAGSAGAQPAVMYALPAPEATPAAEENQAPANPNPYDINTPD